MAPKNRLDTAADLFMEHNAGASIVSAVQLSTGEVVITFRPAGARSSAPVQTYRVWPEMITARQRVDAARTGNTIPTDDADTVPDPALVAAYVAVIEQAMGR